MAFWSALKEAKRETDSGGFSYLKLVDAFFLGSRSNGNGIMLRQCYSDLWDMLIKGLFGPASLLW